MVDNTPIEWADATCNAVNGCSVLSPGCKHCYAMKQAHRVDFRRGLVSRTAGGQVWTGEVYLHEKSLLQPLRWRRPRRIFWNAHGDLFHENVPEEWIDRVFAVCALTPQHRHMILTKRPERMRAYFAEMTEITSSSEARPFPRAAGHVEQWANLIALKNDRDIPWRHRPSGHGRLYGFHADMPWPLPNVWLGTSAEDQTRADERIPPLLATPAAKRFVSLEPLLGEIFLRASWLGDPLQDSAPKIDWVIVGGESGPGARPMHPDWARSLRDQCAAAGVPFFFKQWGEWAVDPNGDRCVALDGINMANLEPAGSNGEGTVRIARVGKKAAGRLLDGREHSGFPA